jgi:hypothetical protein
MMGYMRESFGLGLLKKLESTGGVGWGISTTLAIFCTSKPTILLVQGLKTYILSTP